MKRYSLLLLIILIFACSACNREKAAPVEGMAAPDFTLTDLSGRKVSLSALQGKVTLLNFWATWCPPCREEIPSMVRLNRLMQGKPFQMLAVSIDQGGKGAVEAFFKQSGAVLPTLLDTGGKTAKLYGATGVPETFVIDKKGVILKKIIGPAPWDSPEALKFLNSAIND